MKERNYFYESMEKGQFEIADKEIEKYVDEHFNELIDELIRRIARVIWEGRR